MDGGCCARTTPENLTSVLIVLDLEHGRAEPVLLVGVKASAVMAHRLRGIETPVTGTLTLSRYWIDSVPSPEEIVGRNQAARGAIGSVVIPLNCQLSVLCRMHSE